MMLWLIDTRESFHGYIYLRMWLVWWNQYMAERKNDIMMKKQRFFFLGLLRPPKPFLATVLGTVFFFCWYTFGYSSLIVCFSRHVFVKVLLHMVYTHSQQTTCQNWSTLYWLFVSKYMVIQTFTRILFWGVTISADLLGYFPAETESSSQMLERKWCQQFRGMSLARELTPWNNQREESDSPVDNYPRT